MTRTSMRVWLAAFVALVFVAGAAAGVLIGPRLVGVPAPELAPPPGGAPGAGPGFGRAGSGPMMAAELVRQLAADVGLDAAQREKMEAMFARRRERLLSFNREMRSRFEAEQAGLRRELAEILTPEQLRRLNELERERRGRRRPPRF